MDLPLENGEFPHFPTYLVGGWAYLSEKYEFVSWDDDIANK